MQITPETLQMAEFGCPRVPDAIANNRYIRYFSNATPIANLCLDGNQRFFDPILAFKPSAEKVAVEI